MNENTWYRSVAVGLVVLLISGIFLGLTWGGKADPGPAASSPEAAWGSPAVDFVNLTIAWNPATGLDEYFSANFTVPAHVVVRVTITSYDNGTNPIPASYSTVQGTLSGIETVSSEGVDRSVPAIPGKIAHTFTVLSWGTVGSMMAGDGTGGMLNPVVPPSISVSDPVSVSFSTYFNQTGLFTWACMAPCDPTAMMSPGLMAGTISVLLGGGPAGPGSRVGISSGGILSSGPELSDPPTMVPHRSGATME
ncbi:MAG: hypothetical protein L3K19_04390 [Thermoplasmata archaeon]|nr:hypothetical protein [Thermoplasmata archaeon]